MRLFYSSLYGLVIELFKVGTGMIALFIHQHKEKII